MSETMSEERAMPVGLESSSMPARTCADLRTDGLRPVQAVVWGRSTRKNSGVRDSPRF